MANTAIARPQRLTRHTKQIVKLPAFLPVNNAPRNGGLSKALTVEKSLPEILIVTSFPPRECGIATYSQDLMAALVNKFGQSFSLKVCALEAEKHVYTEGVKYVLSTEKSAAYLELAETINRNNRLEMVLIQHEFGFFHQHEAEFNAFLAAINKPIALVFHTVLPRPDAVLRLKVQRIVKACQSVIVMTQNAEGILTTDYKIAPSKISVIPHGTHLVPHLNKNTLKEKYNLTGRKVFSTFGLLGEGKSIETTLDAMPEIIAAHPDAFFLVIGKTHPNIVRAEGEKYRNFLAQRVANLGLENHVRFVNQYLPLSDLLEYLQLSDIYLFTSKDRNQAVSGTFSYAISCGCPIISTPIPHAREVLDAEAGIIIDFENSKQLAEAVNRLLSNDLLRGCMCANGLQKMVVTAWENTAIAYAQLFEKTINNRDMELKYSRPAVNLDHVKQMTTDFGMIQFAKINQPDLDSGYTIDDNARAMAAMCQHFVGTNDHADLKYIKIYLDFIEYCQQPEGNFLNYVDKDKAFTDQNDEVNLEDANGRTIWALGYLVAQKRHLPEELVAQADEMLVRTAVYVQTIHSTRAMAFAIKGLHEANKIKQSLAISEIIATLADRLVQMYRHESTGDWQWFESYLTYGNSVLCEAMLCAFSETGAVIYENIARDCFDFLLSVIFKKGQIKVVSNQGWHQKGEKSNEFGEQPIDVAYTILTLGRFYEVFKNPKYLVKMQIAFDWFLGKNHLNQIIYNPCTGGCYDGLEEHQVNLNQGAESTVSYLMARLTVEKYLKPTRVLAPQDPSVFQAV